MGSADCSFELDHECLTLEDKKIALNILSFTESLPRTRTGDVIARQLIRSGTSVGANYRSAMRARSRADFISKMAIVMEEADESLYWLELLTESGIVKSSSLVGLTKEADELVAMTVASIKTAKMNK